MMGTCAMDEKLLEENKKIRLLKLIVDLNLAILMQQTDLTLRDAFQIIREAKQAALNLFPDKADAYDLIYAPRFKRIIRERFVISGGLMQQH